ncbi:MAG: UDP-N-acetylglucosamine 2-epimerase (non-hydrolyzing) [Elusimicrobia bacterium]|nr:UDP-N-acetylglucosamine 2-epimerase (non-hydrolyzing) [Elusimicrobiota bacterium]
MIFIVVGARPNFMKMAPIVLEMKKRGIAHRLVHTGQHYDQSMSAVFLKDLGLPAPDIFLGAGSGTHAEQTARIMTAFEKACQARRPRLVVVGGDVNSSLACALAAAKLGIPVAHVEAGLRSFDRSMPEEVNRVLADHLSRLLFTTEPSGTKNLLKEGLPRSWIHFTGNSMIDSLRTHLKKALSLKPWERFGLAPNGYGLVTLHRPSNVDDRKTCLATGAELKKISREIPLIFPIHPRTRERMAEFRLDMGPKVICAPPLGYLEFLGLMARARAVLTDSGGIQEESTALGVPCVTIRRNTERPVTLTHGTNRLAPPGRISISRALGLAMKSKPPRRAPPLWDGRAARRIVQVIEKCAAL